ncbi:hypothetical protein [Nocardioides alcanivorans]|uniref:hypothetical protein n=1 Tax=Nocardioides alcanivorans TaxID=2897352 RepID=UPI001F349B12|nr:hypothetical protein [Nocardioides alcanivorans]
MPQRATPSPPPEDPSEQPLWRGQLAPREGSEDARGHRRRTPRGWGPNVVRILVGFLLVGVVATGVVLWIRGNAPSPLALSELEPGDCLSSPELGQAGADLANLEHVDCEDEHDGEVFATFDAGDEVTDLDSAGVRCGDLLDAVGSSLRSVTERGFEVRPLAVTRKISPDTRVVCFLRSRAGEKMTGTVVDTSATPQTED